MLNIFDLKTVGSIYKIIKGVKFSQTRFVVLMQALHSKDSFFSIGSLVSSITPSLANVVPSLGQGVPRLKITMHATIRSAYES